MALEANTAREIYHKLAATDDRGVFSLLATVAAERAADHIDRKISVETVLLGYSGECLAKARVEALSPEWDGAQELECVVADGRARIATPEFDTYCLLHVTEA